MAYNEDSSASGHDEPWIQWFCGLKGHEMFCEVERSYIEDGFNLYGLRACVSNFSDCLDLILDRIGPDDSDDSHLTQSACTLYGLIHARYIITAHGLDAMYNKYASKEFGTCPLVQCSGQPVLPVGLKDEMGADTVKIFCPKCQNVYHPPPVRSRSHAHGSSNSVAGGASGVDGASFGTTFPHLFLMTFSNLVPDPLPRDSAYVPRIFGFRVHKSARQRAAAPAASAVAAIASTTQAQENTVENKRRRTIAQEVPISGQARQEDGGAQKESAGAGKAQHEAGKAGDAPDITSLLLAQKADASILPDQAENVELENLRRTSLAVAAAAGRQADAAGNNQGEAAGDERQPDNKVGSTKRKSKSSGGEGGKKGDGEESNENGAPLGNNAKRQRKEGSVT